MIDILNKSTVKEYGIPNFINSSLLRYTYNSWNKIKDFDNDLFFIVKSLMTLVKSEKRF